MSENLTDKFPPDTNERLVATLVSIDKRLSALEEAGVRNSYNTRPIWEKVLVRMDGFDRKQDSFEQRQIAFETKLSELEERLISLDSKVTSLDSKVTSLDSKVTSLDSKVTSLDSKVTSLDSKVDEQGLDMRSGFKRLARQKAELASDTIAVRTDQMDLERRMDRLEDRYGDRSGQ